MRVLTVGNSLNNRHSDETGTGSSTQRCRPHRSRDFFASLAHGLASVGGPTWAYYAVPATTRAVDRLRREVWLWCTALRRRSQRHRLTWARMYRLADRWLPSVRIVHPWPTDRFYATT